MLIDQFRTHERINKGWSSDQKYRVTDAQGNAYLLRISPSEQLERKRSEFQWMQRVAALGVPMCQPLHFGSCDEGVYSIQIWIDGADARDAIPAFASDTQYAYGLGSGKILRQIHTLPAPESTEDWAGYFNRKADRKIAAYQSCPLQYAGGQAFIDYIDAHRQLLNGRPQTFQHGDYHIGNMMIGKDARLFIIDFNSAGFGDPWEEFNRIVWCAQEAPRFAAGMVDGYFDGEVPLSFWQLLALYISSNTLSSLPWAIPFGEDQIQIMQNQARDVLHWYDGMRNPVPTWYVRP